MSEKSEIVYDPEKGGHVGVFPAKVPGKKPYLQQVNPRLWRGNETPRLAAARGVFAEINYSAFGTHREPGDEFPQWKRLRQEYADRMAEVPIPRQDRHAERQAHLNELLVHKLGEEETRKFKRTATDPMLVHFSTPAELDLVRNQPAYRPRLQLRRSEQIPL